MQIPQANKSIRGNHSPLKLEPLVSKSWGVLNKEACHDNK